MKKIINILFLCLSIGIVTFFTGCKGIIKPEEVAKISEVVGIASAKVIDVVDMSYENKKNISFILNEINKNIPETNQTCYAVWQPILENKISILLKDEKIKLVAVPMIKNSVLFAATGIDYLFDTYPNFKQNKNLAFSSVKNFIKGFINNMNISENLSSYNNKTILKYEYIYNKSFSDLKTKIKK